MEGGGDDTDDAHERVEAGAEEGGEGGEGEEGGQAGGGAQEGGEGEVEAIGNKHLEADDM